MRRLFPDTLLTRSILMMAAALVLAQCIAILSFKLIAENLFTAMQRSAQIEASIRVLDLAGRSTDVTAFTDEVIGLEGVQFVRLHTQSHVDADSELGREIRAKWEVPAGGMGPVSGFLIGHMSRNAPRGRGPGPGAGEPMGDFPPGREGMHGAEAEMPKPWSPDRFEHGRGFPTPLLIVALEFKDGGWANVLVSSNPLRAPPIIPFIFMLSLSLLGVGTAAALAARWLYKPLNNLASASMALERGEKHTPLPVSGPRDVRNVMEAFNAMATRLEATLQSQQDVLVAIGHDLRTPLTALRIRAAMIEDVVEREKVERSLDQLQSLTEAALQAGTHNLHTEDKEILELGALTESLCDDLRDIHLPVTCEETPGQFLVAGWSDDLTRALRNIIENAVRYGERARVRLRAEGGFYLVEIDDDGPGVPDADMDVIFGPLVRLEKSRNKDTGGHGLGLHIARNAVVAHGGQITLENRPEGGLRVSVALPAYTP